MATICWERYPLVVQTPHARCWLTVQAQLGLAPNTLAAYGRALGDYLAFCARQTIVSESATTVQIAAYVRDLTERPHPRAPTTHVLGTSAGLANATMQQRLTVVRLYYDYLMEEGVRADNPVGRGRYTPGKAFGGHRERGLIPRYSKLPWIPTDDQWRAILQAAQAESLRNRVMLAFAYDAGLRRQELCTISTGDIDPAFRTLHVRAEHTTNRQGRVLPYSGATGELFGAYLQHRQRLSSARGPLFLSESRRNKAQPLSIWTWSKVIAALAVRAGAPQFTTHTLRHLCLTDLARSGWELHEIATFAGHRSIQTTMLYIHLSSRDLAAKFDRSMAEVHTWRMRLLEEALR